jgi:hypothetical protein
VRVRLLELVHGAVDEELAHLTTCPVLEHPARQRSIVISRRQREQRVANVGETGPRVHCNFLGQSLLEATFQPTTHIEQCRRPFPLRVHAREAAVVKLVATRQRELGIVVVEYVDVVQSGHRDPAGRPPKRGQNGLADGSTRWGRFG